MEPAIPELCGWVSEYKPHHKFRSGTLWLSNDPNRILLRAEVQVFVGYVFAELASFQPSGSLPIFR
jgi:hypothetical protein